MYALANLVEVIYDYSFSLCLLFLIILLLTWKKVEDTLPPGPFGLPFLGVIPWLGRKPHLTFTKWSQKYGPLFSVQLGSEKVLVLNDYDVVTEALVKQGNAFSGRPQLYIFEQLNRGRGLFDREGKPWKEQRKFTLTCLRNFGLGKHSLEKRTQEEALVLTDILMKRGGCPIELGHHVTVAMANIMCTMVFGTRFQHNDGEFSRLFKLFDESIQLAEFAGALNFLPVLRQFPGLTKMNKLLENRRKEIEFINKKIQEHAATLDVDNPRDFLDAFLIEIQKQKEQGNDYTTFTVEELRIATMILFMASTETTATTMRWGILYLVANPKVQERIKAEIDDVIGEDRLPCLEDRSQMPYTAAAIMEIQRCGNVMPLSPMHATRWAVNLRGYRIPARTSVMVNLWALHKDSSYWKDPETFDPERFIDSSGNAFKPESFMPFGAGPRICLGDSLARNNLFLLLTALLQKFTFKFHGEITNREALEIQELRHKLSMQENGRCCRTQHVDGSTAPANDEKAQAAVLKEFIEKRIPGITSKPKPYVVCAIPKNDS